jgi:hypothetical protein
MPPAHFGWAVIDGGGIGRTPGRGRRPPKYLQCSYLVERSWAAPGASRVSACAISLRAIHLNWLLNVVKEGLVGRALRTYRLVTGSGEKDQTIMKNNARARLRTRPSAIVVVCLIALGIAGSTSLLHAGQSPSAIDTDGDGIPDLYEWDGEMIARWTASQGADEGVHPEKDWSYDGYKWDPTVP